MCSCRNRDVVLLTKGGEVRLQNEECWELLTMRVLALLGSESSVDGGLVTARIDGGLHFSFQNM